MRTGSKRFRDAVSRVEKGRRYGLEEAIALLKDLPGAKFDETAARTPVVRTVPPSPM